MQQQAAKPQKSRVMEGITLQQLSPVQASLHSLRSLSLLSGASSGSHSGPALLFTCVTVYEFISECVPAERGKKYKHRDTLQTADQI